MNIALSLLGSFAIYKLQKKFSYYIILFNLGVIFLGFFHNDFSIANLIQNKYILLGGLVLLFIFAKTKKSTRKKIAKKVSRILA
jgi:hypothetical protein